MRIKIGDRIFLCTVVSHPEGSELLIITTINDVYTVNMVTKERAEYAYNQILVNGYYDASANKCSN